MSRYQRYGNHNVFDVSVHIVFVTKYRFAVLRGDIQKRAKELIQQICDACDVTIIKGVVSKDHVHIHVSYPPSLSISELVRKIKGRSGRKLLLEYTELKKRYWGGHFWAIGYGAWSTGTVAQSVIDEYLDHHKEKPNGEDSNFIMEE